MDDEVDIGAVKSFLLGEVAQVEVGQKTCALVRDAGDKIWVFEDNCPHLDMPISDGRVENEFIICSWHGAYFDLKTGTSHSPLTAAPLTKVSARVVDGRVLCKKDG